MMRQNFREASLASSVVFAPVTTIFPEENTSAVVFGWRILTTAAAKRWHNQLSDAKKIIQPTLGRYSAFLA
jgi:hypothetical protein